MYITSGGVNHHFCEGRLQLKNVKRNLKIYAEISEIIQCNMDVHVSCGVMCCPG